MWKSLLSSVTQKLQYRSNRESLFDGKLTDGKLASVFSEGSIKCSDALSGFFFR